MGSCPTIRRGSSSRILTWNGSLSKGHGRNFEGIAFDDSVVTETRPVTTTTSLELTLTNDVGDVGLHMLVSGTIRICGAIRSDEGLQLSDLPSPLAQCGPTVAAGSKTWASAIDSGDAMVSPPIPARETKGLKVNLRVKEGD